MNFFIYSDESGVLDTKNKYFIFSLIVFKDLNQRSKIKTLFKDREKRFKKIIFSDEDTTELKGSLLRENQQLQIMSLLKDVDKICVKVNVEMIYDSIMSNKKSKRRYLDFAFKSGLRSYFEELIFKKEISQTGQYNFYFFVDQHTTSTNGIYDLKETIENDFFSGIFSQSSKSWFTPPLFDKKGNITVQYCDSKNNSYIRMADILANYMFRKINKNQEIMLPNLFIFEHPTKNAV
ncbi:DUF3800 domain-containing protein [Mycoplasma procyoni]|uniref:DUF3800 domain-containing protein n=1 Tax=Mycoplasma procyoni TaxID=568784 RepID=UPI00197BD0F0|nr:DUF3800 domain-containing protein [Mycoplasma procyoni]MBN3534448.1 DUF3800 domain-containing protein [Mycoplasma procyoni]